MWNMMIKAVNNYPKVARKLPDLVQFSYQTLGKKTTNAVLENTVYPLYCGSNDLRKLEKLIK